MKERDHKRMLIQKELDHKHMMELKDRDAENERKCMWVKKQFVEETKDRDAKREIRMLQEKIKLGTITPQMMQCAVWNVIPIKPPKRKRFLPHAQRHVI